VKDPFRVEQASRLLPEASDILVTHVGGELEEGMAAEARKRMENNPRYEWAGEQPRNETLRILSRSRLLVHSSRMEGGAHAISEAIACETPVLASDISGNVGLLGPDYPGYFPVESSSALAAKLRRVEAEPEFYRRLQGGVRSKRDIVQPAHEREQLRELFDGVAQEFL
jgi:glycosyltransferase involved in cell wall biosynthesis